MTDIGFSRKLVIVYLLKKDFDIFIVVYQNFQYEKNIISGSDGCDVFWW
jgi:hypothetical protein